MKKIITSIALVVSLGFVASNAQATTYTFADNWKNWNNDASYNSATNSTDEIGTPKIDYMNVTVNDEGYLENVDIVLHESTERQVFDSLFINSYNVTTTDTGWDDWDYFVHDGGSTNSANANGAVPIDGLYTVSAGYTYTTSITGDNGRHGNPNGIDNYFLNSVDSSFGATQTGYTISYDFSSLSLDVSSGFFVAYSPWCANDVIGGDFAPVPEPATMLLFGTGMVGLAGYSRRRKKA